MDFWRENNIDPFIDACTIAGACNKVFRQNYLTEETIGVIPVNGYRLSEMQSVVALKWLYLVEINNNIEIQHAGRRLEVFHPAFGRVDGYNKENNTVYEFDGCYWHGCVTCYPAYFSGVETNREFEKLRHRRDDTIAKHRKIREAEYNLVVMRECDFQREIEECPAMNELLETMVVDDIPLNPRDAFYGGRTNASNLYFKSVGVTKMHYFDVCSLYPMVNAKRKVPIAHPKVHFGEACLKLPWQNMDGLMKVTILPPRRLRHPVLPYKLHNKLLFFLCFICAKNLQQGKCKHNDDERQFTGTWVVDEVKLAVSKGYEIVKIHELWEYEVAQYDPTTKSGGPFTGYINHFLKIKAEASGWPVDCETFEQKQAYIQEYFDHEGVLLDRTKIKKILH